MWRSCLQLKTTSRSSRGMHSSPPQPLLTSSSPHALSSERGGGGSATPYSMECLDE